ncbi:hypothetical protein CRUP_038714 [Coryphaenoides rupestris]|nr:hypothetical protein CRUP_038714 [Coryphaenoides rupestris]
MFQNMDGKELCKMSKEDFLRLTIMYNAEIKEVEEEEDEEEEEERSRLDAGPDDLEAEGAVGSNSPPPSPAQQHKQTQS